jgi:hypothetical protein
MNNTTNLTIAAILVAATLVVGTLGSISTIAQPALAAYGHKKVGSQDNNSRNSKNGNTATIEECKNRGSASGFDTTLDQECENLICTHPGNNATCSQEGITPSSSVSIPLPTPEPITTTLLVKKVVVCKIPGSTDCQPGSFFITIIANNNPHPARFEASESGILVTFSGPGTYTVNEAPPGSFLPPLGTIAFSGDCTKSGEFDATGSINAGEHKTCIITDTQGIR